MLGCTLPRLNTTLPPDCERKKPQPMFPPVVAPCEPMRIGPGNVPMFPAGRYQKLMVKASFSRRSVWNGTVTRPPLPSFSRLKSSAVPNRPGIQAGTWAPAAVTPSVPVCGVPTPDESAAVVPEPSSNFQ
jgi:hypothetical protein